MRKNNAKFQKIKNVILWIHSYECFICGYVSISNHVHHIDKNPTNNNAFNLLPLCPDCHKNIHTMVAIKVHFEDENIINELLRLNSFF